MISFTGIVLVDTQGVNLNNPLLVLIVEMVQRGPKVGSNSNGRVVNLHKQFSYRNSSHVGEGFVLSFRLEVRMLD
jgi:hypothetical protein